MIEHEADLDFTQEFGPGASLPLTHSKPIWRTCPLETFPVSLLAVPRACMFVLGTGTEELILT